MKQIWDVLRFYTDAAQILVQHVFAVSGTELGESN